MPANGGGPVIVVGSNVLGGPETRSGYGSLSMTWNIMSSGRDIAEHARKLHPGARVLHMSGYTDDAVLRRGVLERGAAFIEKPFSSEELARRVRDVLDGPPAERSAA